MLEIKLGAALLCALMLAGCGGGGFDDDDDTHGSTTAGASAASINIIAGSSQLPLAASTSDDGITITAIVKDANNALLSDATVTFSADAGTLEVTSATTDSSGLARSTLRRRAAR
ncbi:MAG: Ig-like domain-containing protein [Solimonas sp.]